MRYFIIFSYDGSNFHGFQRQKDVKNVQSLLEESLSKLLGEDILIKGSGRTDALVHAKGQTATFDCSKKIKTIVIKNKLNELFNGEIIIKKIKKVNNNFHARFSAKGKWYRYIINNGNYIENLDNYTYQIKYDLDIKKMKKTSSLFIGDHDFRNFVSGSRNDYHTYIKKISIKRKNNKIIIDFYGTGFYRYMVRNLVGAILDIGRGKVDISVVQEMLDNPLKERQLSTVPAQGLYLMKVYY